MEILDIDKAKKKTSPKERITPSFLTKYERARIIGNHDCSFS